MYRHVVLGIVNKREHSTTAGGAEGSRQGKLLCLWSLLPVCDIRVAGRMVDALLNVIGQPLRVTFNTRGTNSVPVLMDHEKQKGMLLSTLARIPLSQWLLRVS